MSADLLRPPAHLTKADALRLSQEAPAILKKYSGWTLPFPLSRITADDSPEKWVSLENLFYACILTGDNKSAFGCLDMLKERFGAANERIMGLTGVYHEAIAPDDKAAENVLKQYEEVIADSPTNFIIRKRHVAFLKALGRVDGAIAALVDLLDVSPIDGEAWAELGELYYSRGYFPNAIHCMEEVLLVTPNAWNVHVRLAEMVYTSTMASAAPDVRTVTGLTRAMKSFCRSVELCDDYLRGYYGLKLVTNTLRDMLPKLDNKMLVAAADAENGLAPPSIATAQKLNELATSKLAEIIRRSSTGESGWQGYEEAELISARELLDRNASKAPK